MSAAEPSVSFEAFEAAFQESTRWLVIENAVGMPLGSLVVRYGPFATREAAQKFAADRCEGMVTYATMHDVDVLDATVQRVRDAERERDLYNSTLAESVSQSTEAS